MLVKLVPRDGAEDVTVDAIKIELFLQSVVVSRSSFLQEFACVDLSLSKYVRGCF